MHTSAPMLRMGEITLLRLVWAISVLPNWTMAKTPAGHAWSYICFVPLA